MKSEINAGNSLIFLLQREYISECRIEIAKDEEGNFKTDESGKTIERAVHPLNLSFTEWLQKHNLIQERSQILRPEAINKPLQIIKS